MPWIFSKTWAARSKAQSSEIDLHETRDLAHNASRLDSLNRLALPPTKTARLPDKEMLRMMDFCVRWK